MYIIKDCPHCGGACSLLERRVYVTTEHYVMCSDCGSKSRDYCVDGTYLKDGKEIRVNTREEAEMRAVEDWNAREINGDTSDGYHTFNELYHHRAILFSAVVKNYQSISWKSKLHHDGTMFDNMFIVGINTPEGQATYHYDIEPYWDMFDCEVLERAPEWDGHTSEEAINRIYSLTRRPKCKNYVEILKDTRKSCLSARNSVIQAESVRDLANKSSPNMKGFYLEKLLEAHSGLQDRFKEYQNNAKKAEEVINLLDDERYKAILTLRYITGLGWIEISDKLHYTASWVQRLKKEAFRELGRISDE